MMRPGEMSGRENAGAGVPSGSMLEDTDIEIGMSASEGGRTTEEGGEIFC